MKTEKIRMTLSITEMKKLNGGFSVKFNISCSTELSQN